MPQTDCACSLQVRLLKPSPKAMVLGGRVSGKGQGHEGRDFVSGIRALIKEGSGAPSSFHHLGTQKKVKELIIYEPGSQVLSRHPVHQHLDLGLPSLQTHEKEACVVYKPWRWEMVRAAQEDEGKEKNVCCNAENTIPENSVWAL